MDDHEGGLDRRTFLSHSVLAIGSGTLGRWAELRDLIARSRAAQRPPLSEAAVSSYLANVRSNAAARQAFLAAAQSDVRALVRGTFTLTAAQERNLAALTTTDVSTIVNAIGRGFAGRNDLRFRMAVASATNASPQCSITAARSTRLVDGASAEVWTLTSRQECVPYLGC